ncbi:MFS transporter [Ktedonospora formicarum]|uniref:MFS transporter n=1 Tax=Ktedonospora formicarum TaxID=2778364 RepID=A0A8J3MN67_9CHLR|nr:MFS transporter [Ktedonospora formicarum]GHO42387.1 MFS transporter [Ktedonospora formicarum]
MRKVSMITNGKYLERRCLRVSRIAIITFFFFNGVLTSTFSTRLPAIQAKLALPSGQLGLALLGCTIGGLVAMNIAARIAQRLGSKMMMIVGSLCMGLSLLLIAYANNLPFLLMALIGFGAGSGAMDIAMNLQGTDIEQAYGQPMLNSFHACFSVGSLAGALIGSVLATFNLSPELHFLAIVGIASISFILSSRFLLPPKVVQKTVGRDKGRAPQLGLRLMFLGLIGFCVLLSVGAMYDWSTVYLSGTLHMDAGLAAAGFTIFLTCTALTRGIGDNLTKRFGAAVLIACSCALSAIGLTVVLLFTWTPIVLCGLGLIGIGLSVPFPLTLSAAGRLSTRDSGSALATVTTWGYAGMIAGPPMLGFIADHIGLRLALTVVIFLCLLAALCAPAARIISVKVEALSAIKTEVD